MQHHATNTHRQKLVANDKISQRVKNHHRKSGICPHNNEQTREVSSNIWGALAGHPQHQAAYQAQVKMGIPKLVPRG